ncbi:MAG: hypothetical protein CMQ49_14255 [Gammaproteobacteria bacterium]|nr:hypothetical protein [Gammaproteobacteria bacterium]|tara:strand:+ start:1076 stop:1807 length:732 start_codon:yes stop_codon:yes gene_type:complete
MAFVLSTVALLAGPFVYALGQRHQNARQIFDGFIFITIAGIVCVHIIPGALDSGGMWALAFLVLGLVFPVALERLFDRTMHEAHGFILLIAALGLVVHAVIDGIALLPHDAATPGSTHLGTTPLALGVILHRLPVGMAIWWSLRPHFSAGVAIVTYAVVILATGLSYFLGDPIVAMSQTAAVAYFQAFVAGSLVHVVAFGVSHTHDGHVEPGPLAASPHGSWGYRLGILIGLFVVFTTAHIGG